MRIRYVFVILCLWLISGCGRVDQNKTSTVSATEPVKSSTAHPTKPEHTEIPLPTETATVFPNRKPSWTPRPTSTVTLTPTPTATKEIIPFPTPASSSAIRQQCFSVLDELPKGLVLTGTLLLDLFGFEPDPYKNKAYTLDFSSGEIRLLQDISDAIPNIYTISPDRKWFVYTDASADGEGSQLHIRSLDGQELPIPYWDESWGRSMRWFDEKRLAIYLPAYNKDGSRNWQVYGTIVIYNPFTGEWKRMPPNFPSGLNIDQLVLEYDPSLTRALYLSGAYYVLWNSNTQTDIWKKGWAFPPYLYTAWSPDGNQFVVVIGKQNISQSDLYLVTWNGEESMLTNLAEAYPSILNIYIEYWEWSPDGRTIAFTVYLEDNVHEIRGPTLMLVDVATKQVIDTCLIVYPSFSLVWSPDSKQIAVSSPADYQAYYETKYKPVSQNLIVYLVDIAGGYAAQIAENYSPTGWMLNAP